MTALSNVPELAEIARRIIWFESPREALADTARFLAYAMRYARFEDMKTIRRYIDDDAFRSALDVIPPGIVDGRSWSYWNAMLGRYPAPPMPERVVLKSPA